MSTFVIANPRSRLGETGARLTEIRALLQRYVGEHELLLTTCQGDGERLSREACERGATRIIVAGGDGTISEVLTGLLAKQERTEIWLGILPLGTGRDFARLLGLSTGLEAAMAGFAQAQPRRVDAGRITLRAEAGGDQLRCFLNIASFGLSGQSALWLRDRAAQGKRGPFSYVVSSFVGLSRYHSPGVTLTLDDQLIHEGPLLLAAAANGQYFAGGMQVAPGASIDDGLFDVVFVGRLPVAQAVARLPLLLGGLHIDGHRIRVRRGRVLEAHSQAQVWIEADGEPMGTLPARFELLPGAINLYGLP